MSTPEDRKKRLLAFLPYFKTGRLTLHDFKEATAVALLPAETIEDPVGFAQLLVDSERDAGSGFDKGKPVGAAVMNVDVLIHMLLVFLFRSKRHDSSSLALTIPPEAQEFFDAILTMEQKGELREGR